WYYNPDGTRSFLIGYYNRNQQQELDIPIGPNNHIDPGGPDMGQPTHFLTGRQWGMFSVPVPRAFKDTDSYFWEITANGQTTKIPLRVHSDYVMSPFTEISVGNTPPSIRFEENGKSTQGPLANLATAGSRNDEREVQRGRRLRAASHRERLLGRRRRRLRLLLVDGAGQSQRQINASGPTFFHRGGATPSPPRSLGACATRNGSRLSTG